MPKKPAPFSRPSVDLGGHGKEWREVEAQSLVNGDIVKDYGSVEDVILGQYIVAVAFLSGKRMQYHVEEKVEAFVTRR